MAILGPPKYAYDITLKGGVIVWESGFNQIIILFDADGKVEEKFFASATALDRLKAIVPL
jgi:hypothetical protein